MSNYKKMYLTLFKANQEAIELLIAAQRECEELYISAPEAEIKVLMSERKPGIEKISKNS